MDTIAQRKIMTGKESRNILFGQIETPVFDAFTGCQCGCDETGESQGKIYCKGCLTERKWQQVFLMKGHLTNSKNY